MVPADSDPVDDPKKRPRDLRESLMILVQGVAFIVAISLAVQSLLLVDRVGFDDVPTAITYGSIGVTAAVLLLWFPAIFWRLPLKARWFAFGGLLVAWVAVSIAENAVRAAYWNTPLGKRDAAAYAKASADFEEGVPLTAETQGRDGAEEALAEAAATQKEVQEYARKLESCFTFFGHRLPQLEKLVKEGLHNPNAFEHVETVTIVPDENRNNVSMRFRGENGFGAIRLGTVRAQLIADGCEVQNVTEVETN